MFNFRNADDKGLSHDWIVLNIDRVTFNLFVLRYDSSFKLHPLTSSEVTCD